MSGSGLFGHAGVRSVLLAAAGVLLAAIPVLAAVEPGIYFDVDKAAVGQPVALVSAADYVVCWSADAPDQVLENRPVYLARAGRHVDSPGDPELIAVQGTWSLSEGALAFSFTVPQLPKGRYDGYVGCTSGTLDHASRTLRILGMPPTDAEGPVTGQGSTDWAPAIVVVAVLGFVIGGARARGRPIAR